MSTSSTKMRSDEAWGDLRLCIQMAQAQLSILSNLQQKASSLGVGALETACQLQVVEVLASAAISHLEACRLAARRLQGKGNKPIDSLPTTSSQGDLQSEQVEEDFSLPASLSAPLPVLEISGEGVGTETGVGEYKEWAKYGKRQLAGASYLRHYYRCRHFRNGCPAKRFEDVSKADGGLVGRGSLGGEHNHAADLKFKPRKRKRDDAGAAVEIAAQGGEQAGIDDYGLLDGVDGRERGGEVMWLDSVEMEVGQEWEEQIDSSSFADLLDFSMEGMLDVSAADIDGLDGFL